jgi:digeranylgeranylglycerophospholipid reductase
MTGYKQPLIAKNPEVIVVGGGPVGSYTALNLAKKGVKVTVFEEHPQIGVPSHCAGHISIRSLKKMGLYPIPEGIFENKFCTANFYSPYGTKFSLHLSCPVTVALNRVRFDQYLARQAEAAGATFAVSSYVQSLVMADGYVKGINVTKDGGATVQVDSKILVDAEGVSSRLLRQTGLTPLKPSGIVFAVEAEMENVQNVDLDAVEVFFGKSYAPGFYGWLIPKPDGSAKVGLATKKGDPREYLKRLMTKHPIAAKQLVKAKITQVGYHAITLAGSIPQTYTNGFLAVGDCASQVKPTTGGGVIFGLTAAKQAAEVAGKAIAQDDVSSVVMQEYQKRCNDLFRFDFNVMLRLRRFLNSLSDEKIDEMLRVCDKLGIDKALHNVDEIDFQGKMLLTAIQKPSMAAALLYFSLLYLSTNP